MTGQTCPIRMVSSKALRRPGLDGWTDDGRCSFCGSITPEQFLAYLRLSTRQDSPVRVRRRQKVGFFFSGLPNTVGVIFRIEHQVLLEREAEEESEVKLRAHTKRLLGGGE